MSKVITHLVKSKLISSEFELCQEAIKRSKNYGIWTRLIWNTLPYSYYAYGTYHAAKLAKRLGLKKISVAEFGVAGGNGLLALERHANSIGEVMGIEIDVYGFDTGEGLPPPKDYRDMPYRFRKGNYAMDQEALSTRLKSAKLILGEITDTKYDFFKKYTVAPFGFIAIDLDYYSSTMDALSMFDANCSDNHILPRAQFYFDNTVGTNSSSYNEFVGELLAINDFNSNNDTVKIAKCQELKAMPFNFEWHHQLYVMHRFQHDDYSTYVSTAGPENLSIKQS